MKRDFWRNRRIFLTGHTGFKGAWLSIWLERLGAKVYGFSAQPPSTPSLFEEAQVAAGMTSTIGDIRDLPRLREALATAQPDLVIHFAAQSLVRESYVNPVDTFSTNVLGTVNLLQACRDHDQLQAVLIITTDKCYENREWLWGYRETDALGGHDPYSASKACAEIVTAAYRRSFFAESKTMVASARAGNVIGGGDWAKDRLIPDVIRSFQANEAVPIRSPNAVRPWQHVLDPLHGYLMLCEHLIADDQPGEAWNFGPEDDGSKTVLKVVEGLARHWGSGAERKIEIENADRHEAQQLRLDCAKARSLLGWKPALDFETTLHWVARWYRDWAAEKPARDLVYRDLDAFEEKCI